MATTDQAIDGIRQLIASGEFRPGAKLSREKELALRLGVSRNSLREAVRALELVGVVEARQGDGTYVTSLDPSLLLDVISYVIDFSHEEATLQLLEVRPAARARRHGASRRARDAGAARRDRRAAGGDAPQHRAESLLEADSAFHAAIAHASGNPALAALLGNLSGTTFRARISRAYSDARAVENTRREHRRIYDALRAADPDLARAASAYHVGGVETWLREVFARRQAAGAHGQRS